MTNLALMDLSITISNLGFRRGTTILTIIFTIDTTNLCEIPLLLTHQIPTPLPFSLGPKPSPPPKPKCRTLALPLSPATIHAIHPSSSHPSLLKSTPQHFFLCASLRPSSTFFFSLILPPYSFTQLTPLRSKSCTSLLPYSFLLVNKSRQWHEFGVGTLDLVVVESMFVFVMVIRRDWDEVNRC